ncbi:MAG TPA: hypothetical protein VKU41_00050 [Polyangiaceae bacterium]|nr:hypothetical protein [Polyangiaceae bacterium]
MPALRFVTVTLVVGSSACVIPISPISTNASPEGGVGTTVTTDASSPDGGTPAMPESAPPPGSWINITGQLANMSSTCGNLSNVFAKPDEDELIADVAAVGLWATRDNGATWQELGTAMTSAPVTNRAEMMLVDPRNPQSYWEAGSYGPCVYQTEDDGTTFAQLGSAAHCDAVSVDFSDPNRLTLLATAHEQPQTLFRSTDGGKTWANVGAPLPKGAYCSTPLVLDGQTHLVGCGLYGSPLSGIYRTNDGGANWSQISPHGGGSGPLVASDHSIYWAMINAPGLVRGSADGQTWTDLVGPGMVSGRSIIELPDGRIATLASNHVMASKDHGATWQLASAELPYPDAVGVTYSAQRKAFYVWHNDCNGVVLPDAVMRFDFDYQTE